MYAFLKKKKKKIHSIKTHSQNFSKQRCTWEGREMGGLFF